MDNSEPRMKTYHIKSEAQGTLVTTQTQSDFTLKTDLAKRFGGQGQGASPIELLLASLVGCENQTSRNIAKQLGFTILNVSFDIHAERDERGGVSHLPLTEDAPITSSLTRVWGTVLVETDGTQEQLKQVEEILKKRCPIARMFVDSGCKVEMDWQKLDD